MQSNELNPTAPTIERKYFAKKSIFFVLIFFGLMIFFTVIFFLSSNFQKSDNFKKMIALNSISPTPMPFYEMTVPYLRERKYESKLNETNQINSNSNYKTLLTSYDSDGFKINALLTIPNTDMPIGGFPAIVFVHGYIPPTLYETNGQSYSSYVDFLARNGFVVLKIDLRGHGNSEGEAGGGYYGSDYVVDTLNAYAALQSSEFVNPEKIGLWGHSMAGNVLLRTFVIKPTIPAVNIWAGAVYTYYDRLKYGINDLSFRPPATANETRRRRNDLIQKYGEFSENSIFWKLFVPTNYLGDIKGALQINHAVDDTTVNIGYSRDLMKLLDQTNVIHELIEYPSGGHNITGVNFTKAMQNTVDFFNKYLKN